MPVVEQHRFLQNQQTNALKGIFHRKIIPGMEMPCCISVGCCNRDDSTSSGISLPGMEMPCCIGVGCCNRDDSTSSGISLPGMEMPCCIGVGCCNRDDSTSSGIGFHHLFY